MPRPSYFAGEIEVCTTFEVVVFSIYIPLPSYFCSKNRGFTTFEVVVPRPSYFAGEIGVSTAFERAVVLILHLPVLLCGLK